MGKFRGKKVRLFVALTALWMVSACSQQPAQETPHQLKVGVELSEIGLGDQSFSDAAFRGLIQARNEDGIVFDYQEISKTKSYEDGFEQLVQEDSDLVIGLGFMVKDSLEKVAKKYPDRQFVIVDETSDLPNVSSITFKEEEGSYLAGVIAADASRTGNVGFLGGVESDLLHKFQIGFEKGAKAVNPDARVITAYAGDFGKPELGAEMAQKMIQQDRVDVIYAAAGLTGVGAIQEVEKQGKYAIGVDNDQFFLAEKAVITSMVKHVDVAIHTAVKTFIQNKGTFPQKNMVFGLNEDGVGLTPLHNITLEPDQQQKFDDFKEKLASGSITVPVAGSVKKD